MANDGFARQLDSYDGNRLQDRRRLQDDHAARSTPPSPRSGREEEGEEMRTPQRMRFLVQQLESTWRLCPTLRLGQLIVNVLPDRFRGDPFNVEDDDLMEALEDYRPEAKVKP